MKLEKLPNEVVEQFSKIKKELEDSITKAELFQLKASESKLIAQNKDLEFNLLLYKVYLEFGLSKMDKINHDTGAIEYHKEDESHKETEGAESNE